MTFTRRALFGLPAAVRALWAGRATVAATVAPAPSELLVPEGYVMRCFVGLPGDTSTGYILRINGGPPEHCEDGDYVFFRGDKDDRA